MIIWGPAGELTSWLSQYLFEKASATLAVIALAIHTVWNMISPFWFYPLDETRKGILISALTDPSFSPVSTVHSENHFSLNGAMVNLNILIQGLLVDNREWKLSTLLLARSFYLHRLLRGSDRFFATNWLHWSYQISLCVLRERSRTKLPLRHPFLPIS